MAKIRQKMVKIPKIWPNLGESRQNWPIMSLFGRNSPREDPHFVPTRRGESIGNHYQATALQAAERGWFFRSEWYQKLVPDTRRCVMHGEIMFPELDLTNADQNLAYTDQNRGMASGPPAGGANH